MLRGGDTRPAIVPGEPEKSLLIEAIRYENSDLQMPPKKKLAGDADFGFRFLDQVGSPLAEHGQFGHGRKSFSLRPGNSAAATLVVETHPTDAASRCEEIDLACIGSGPIHPVQT